MKPSPARTVTLHAVRLAVVVCVAAAISRTNKTGDASLRLPPAAIGDAAWTAWFPAGRTLTADGPAARVFGESGDRVGTLFQTSPDGEAAVGFSGPSNVLIGVGPDERIVGATILASGDTAEHVAAVNRSGALSAAWAGVSLVDLERDGPPIGSPDGVSGATLTYDAASSAVRQRLGVGDASALFPGELSAEDVRPLFPDATAVEPRRDVGRYDVLAGGTTVGTAVRPTRLGVRVVGYQGPTDVVAGFDREGQLLGAAILSSYDNEPYLGYLREEPQFLDPLVGLSADELAAADLYALGVEGVSGATMTSLAVAQSLQTLDRPPVRRRWASGPVCGNAIVEDRLSGLWPTGVFVIAACGLVFRPGRRRLRWVWPALAVGVVGVWQGDLLSLAMLRGWAESGVSTGRIGGTGLLVVAAAAFFVPAATGRNVYCSHVCPHGAVQMLVKNRLPWRVRLGRRWHAALSAVPWLTLLAAAGVAASGAGASLVGWEPFDAWLWPVCGWATAAVAGVGLAGSLVVPMGYCRYGCPTGALLKWVSRSGAGRWRLRDWGGVTLAAAAVWASW